jgi:hypothetical protein
MKNIDWFAVSVVSLIFFVIFAAACVPLWLATGDETVIVLGLSFWCGLTLFVAMWAWIVGKWL